MKIECLCISTNYSDFLDTVIPLNKSHFDKYTIITKSTDIDTISVANKHGVDVQTTTLLEKSGAKFNKGAVYNDFFNKLEYKDWVVIIDSDIALPSNFRSYFQYFNVECFHAPRRADVPDRETLNKILNKEINISELLLFRGFGYGYLQIFNAQSEVFKSLGEFPYRESYASEEADWIFRNSWGDNIFNPPLGQGNPHLIKDYNDYSDGLLRESPFSVLHLGIPGINFPERRALKF